jgi:hypothetical protein
MKDQNEYLNETEVGHLTKRALSTLRNERFNRRGIPYIKIGKSVRYNKKDVIDFMEQRKVFTESRPNSAEHESELQSMSCFQEPNGNEENRTPGKR